MTSLEDDHSGRLFSDVLTLNALLTSSTTRWTARRKAEVVAAVDGRLLTFDEACDRYSLTAEELTSWQRAIRLNGIPGLRVTRIQQYRDFCEQAEVVKRKSDAGVKRFLAALSG